MFELFVLFVPLVGIVSFYLGYLFKGGFTSWLLKRNTKSSYLDAQNPTLKDNNKDAKEVLDRLLNSVDYVIDNNIAIEAAPLAVEEEDKTASATSSSSTSTFGNLLEQGLSRSLNSIADSNIKFSKEQNLHKVPVDYHQSFYQGEAYTEPGTSVILNRLLADKELQVLKAELAQDEYSHSTKVNLEHSLDANESAGERGKSRKTSRLPGYASTVVEQQILTELNQLLDLEEESGETGSSDSSASKVDFAQTTKKTSSSQPNLNQTSLDYSGLEKSRVNNPSQVQSTVKQSTTEQIKVSETKVNTVNLKKSVLDKSTLDISIPEASALDTFIDSKVDGDKFTSDKDTIDEFILDNSISIKSAPDESSILIAKEDSSPHQAKAQVSKGLDASTTNLEPNKAQNSDQASTNLDSTAIKIPQTNAEVENWQISRSFADLQKPVSVLAKDVSHLLEVQLLAGLVNMQRGDYNRAIKIYRNILASPSWKEEGHELAQINLARCYFSAGIYSRALDLLFPLLEESSKFEKEIIELLLKIYLVNSDWKAALAVAKGAYELNPSHRNLENLIHFYLQRLIQCYSEIGHKRTMFAFQKIIELNKDSVRPYFSRGNYHFALGDYKSALEDYRKVLEDNIELLPALIPNLAYCFGGLNIVGEDLGNYLERLRKLHADQAWIDLYLDLYLTGINFIDKISNFEYKNIAQSSEVSRDLAYSASIEARDIGLDEEMRIKLYGKKSKASIFLINLANSITFSKTHKPDLQQRLTILLQAYQESENPVILERILEVIITIFNSLPLSLVAEAFTLHEKQESKANVEAFSSREDDSQNTSFNSNNHESLKVLFQKLGDMVSKEHYPQITYSCKHCGFRSGELFWLCPSCNRWETILF